MMMRRIAWCAVALAVIGCNAILDNKPGVLLEQSSPGTDIGNDGGPATPRTPEEDAAPPDTTGCPEGEMRCQGTCVSMNDPLYGCGSPTCTPCNAAHGTAACQGRKCVLSACAAGYADCNQSAADGCEADLSRPASCGACNAVCPPTAPMCAPAGGGFQCGTGCTPAAPLLCGLECVDPQTSVNHCGACGRKCERANATAACTAGECEYTCAPNHMACGDACAACPPAVPNTQPTCAGNACQLQCVAPFADCDMNPANGCEANTSNDPLRCGGCAPCPADHTCNNGVCTAPPPPPPPPPP